MYHSFIHYANIWWEPTLCQILLLVLQHSCVQRRQNPNYVLLIIQQLAGVGGGKRTYLHDLFIYIMYIFLSRQIYQPNITELRAGKGVHAQRLWALSACGSSQHITEKLPCPSEKCIPAERNNMPVAYIKSCHGGDKIERQRGWVGSVR